MKYRKILSTVLAVHMLSNCIMQAVPAGAISISDNTDTEIPVLSEETKFNVATGNPIFVTESEDVELGENTISDSCGDDAVWTYDTDSHILVINGSGSVLTLTYKSDKIQDYLSEIQTIVVENEITALNENIFDGCTNVSKLVLPFAGFNADDEEQECTLSSLFGSKPENLTSIQITGGKFVPDSFCHEINSLTDVILADSIKTIGSAAFSYTSLTSLTLPVGLETIGEGAFGECDALTELIFSDRLETIGDRAFNDCNSLANITFNGNSLISIGTEAFAYCNDLTEVTLPDGMETIKDNAFAYCSALTSFYIPASVTEIGSYILYGCNEVKNLSIPAINIISADTNYTLNNIFYYTSDINLVSLEITGGTVIPSGFSGNISADSLKIADTVIEIGDYAFNYFSITELEIPSSVTTIGYGAFSDCFNLAEINIPKSVTKIDSYAFSGCTGLTSVNLPTSLTEIGERAFEYDSNLTELIIPESVTSIGENILYGCNSLKKLVIPFAVNNSLNSILGSTVPETFTSLEITGGTEIPKSYCESISSLTDIKLADSITSIGDSAFYNCVNLSDITMSENIDEVGAGAFTDTAWYTARDNGIVYAGKVALSYKGTIPKNFELKFKAGTVGIADGAFYDQDNITSVKFSETIKYIGNSAFYDCDGITSVNIPKSVITLGSYAFENCSNLSTVELSENISHIGSNPFGNTLWDSNNEDGAVYIGKVFVGYKGEMPKKTKLVLKDGTTEISDNALYDCSNLSEIVIPDTVTSIGKSAFSGCISLKSLEIPDSVTYIGESAFYGCTGITSVKIPDSVTYIGEFAFNDCTSLKSVDISDNIKEIYDYTFNNCISLTSIVIPNNVNDIGEHAFYNNKALREVTVSGTVKSAHDAFEYDYDKDDDTVERNLVISDGSKSIENSIVSALKDTLVGVKLPETLTSIGESVFNDCDWLTEIVIPETVTSIGHSAFYDCDGLTEITIPASVKTIGGSAFGDCENLQYVALNEGLETIGNWAFDNCSSINSITIPDTVTEAGVNAFYYCTSLKKATLSSSIKKISDSMFQGCSSLESISIPHGVEEIEKYAFAGCAVLTKIEIPDTIKSVHYAAYNYGNDDEDPHNITLVIADGSKTVTSDMTNGLKSITDKVILPDTLETIGDGAFEEFESISEIKIPKNVVSIGDWSFENCISLKNVVLPESLTSTGRYTFAFCSSLESINIPESITEISNGLFSNCIALNNITLSDNITSIGESAFANCESLESVVIPNSVTDIGEHAFYECNSLSEITIPESIEIGSDAFDFYYYNDEKSKIGRKIIFVDGTEEITRSMVTPFRNNAVKFVLPDSVTKINNEAFEYCSKLEEINLPDSITSIGEYAFSECTNLKSLIIPESITKISKGLCCNCTNLETVTLPSKINRITENAFYNCINLKKIISDVSDFRFRSTSFKYCSSLFDARFMVLDKGKINFSSNADNIKNNGIVNFSLSYKLTPFLLEEKTNPLLEIYIPDGMTFINPDDAGFDEYYNTFRKEITNKEGTINFSVRVNEYGEYNVNAALTFTYDDDEWNEAIGSVNVKSPPVSISTPSVINTPKVKVKGFAKCGEEVTIFADNKKAGSVTANENTGKYYVEVSLPEKENGGKYDIYASVADETTNTVSVLYEPEKPMVEAVYVSYNGDNQHMDITSAFTEGKRPVISINPSYPFEFEIEMSNSDNVSKLFVISQKGDETKSIEAYWNSEKQVWVAFGYFDPGNTSYVPGTLNISVYEREPAVIDVSNGTINASDEIMEAIYENSGIDRSEWSNKIEELPQVQLPEEVDKNTTSEVIYESSNAVISDFYVSDGQDSEDLSVYMDTSDTIVVDGKQVTADQVAKNPESYGFMRSELSTVDTNGNQYDFYTRVPNSADAALHIYDNFEKNNNKNPNNNNDITVEDMLKWAGATGTQTIRVAKDTSNKSDSKEDSIFLNTLVTTAKSTTIGEFVNAVGESAKLDEMLGHLKSPESLVKWVKDEPDNFAATAWKTYNNINKVIKVAKIGSKTLDRFNKLDNIENSTSLKVKAGALAAAEVGYTLVGSKVIGEAGAAVGAKIGAAIGSFFCPGAGTVIGGVIGGLAGKIAAKTAGSSLFKWANKKLDEQIAFAEGGYMTVLIDPSGYVYEAVKENRISGAKMTIYYKDPETGKEIEWSADDFDQKNPLITDKNGEYAWDVPEGLWRVKFEKDGYETAYSEWMDVPPIQTGVNFSVKSLEEPEILSAVVVDGAIVVAFSKYMNVSTVNAKSVSVTADKKNVSCVVVPFLSDAKDAYTDTFTIKPADEKVISGSLSVTFADICKSYSGVSLATQTVKIEVPVNIISLAVDNNKVVAAQNADTDITITARPASIATGKKIVLSETNDDVTVAEAVFDENGKAVISVNSALTGISKLTFGVEGSDLAITVTMITVTPEEYEILNVANNDTEDSSEIILGDVNDDGIVNLKDAVMIRRYIAGNWDIDINEAIADVNGDGTVNLKDVVMIRRYIAGNWDVSFDNAA